MTERPIEEILQDLAAEVPQEEWDRLPPDLTDHLDEYLYRARTFDIAADYRVLRLARRWAHEKREAFCRTLRGIWGDRRPVAGYPSQGAILYEPGDYSRAALEAVRKDR